MNIALIADGANMHLKDKLARQVSEVKFGGTDIMLIPFYGQQRSNGCVSAVAAIAIEFQRYHSKSDVPHEIHPSKTVPERLTKALHKVQQLPARN